MAGVGIENWGEINVGGLRLPILGQVKVTNISVVPNPVIFGDVSRQTDTQIMSQLIQDSWAGGSGVYRAQDRVDIDRSWKSESETRFRNQLGLPPLTYAIGKPAALGTENCRVTGDYQGKQYFIWDGGVIYRWDDSNVEYGDGIVSTGVGWTLVGALPTNATDWIVYKDFVFIARDTGLHMMNSSGTLSDVTAQTYASYLQIWDNKLYVLGITAGVWTMRFTLDNPASGVPTSWTAAGSFPSGVTPSQLLVFRDVAGNIVLAALSDVGLWLYDAVNTQWRQTEIRIPQMPLGQPSRGDIFRDGKLYFTSGNLGVVGVQPGNPFIATPVGLDLEDGVPPEDSGFITRAVADFNWMLYLIDSTGVVTTDIYASGLGPPFDTPEWDVVQGYMTLRAWNGNWHRLWQASSQGSPGLVLAVSGAYVKRRVYWGAAGQIYWQALPTQVHNPRFNPIAEFAAGPTDHQSPWFSVGSSGQDKIMGHLEIRTSGCSATEKITCYYGTDLDDTTWTAFTEVTGATPNNVITTNGVHILYLLGRQGKQCRYVRFRFVFQRGTDKTKTPRLEYTIQDFMRALPATYGYAVDVNLLDEYDGKTPELMLATLKALSDPELTPGFISFSYTDQLSGIPQTMYGRISRLTGQEEGGSDRRGESVYTLSFMCPYLKDSE